MKKQDLFERLEEYCSSGFTPMHMPGAKRNADFLGIQNPYVIDITEIDGFDNLHKPEGILLDSMKNTAQLYGAEESLYLVNGSTAGVMSAICGATFKGDNIIVARNCHISVYNAIALNELNPFYIIPEIDNNTGIYKGITLQEFKKFFEECGDNITFCAAVITSPTYEGYISEVREIAEFLHKKGIILIVDEAHGAHFNFDKAFPDSAIKSGADLVINSIHKTLPAFTQTALLHINGEIVNRERVKRYWNMLQTTSPSYLLMGSIDRCMRLLGCDGKRLFSEYVERLVNLRARLSKLKTMELLSTDDISKIIIKCRDGKKLYERLIKDYKVQLEMASFRYVIAMTSVGDKAEYYETFALALEKIDEEDCECVYDQDEKFSDFSGLKNVPQIAMKPCEALDLSEREGYDIMDIGADCISVVSGELEGKISAGSVLVYPPGVPVINAGERFSKEIIELITQAIASNLEVIGLKEGKILCLK